MEYDVIVIGAGAAGCFAAIRLLERKPTARVLLLESGRKPLGKVEISGGGRCNVTHACYDPAVLTTYYPRGGRELLGPFHRFQPQDMIDWLSAHGVKTRAEADGRVFPVSNSSQSIIDCFLRCLQRLGAELRTSVRVTGLSRREDGHWQVALRGHPDVSAPVAVVATGSDARTWEALAALGHTIIPPVPSLFTFHVAHAPLTELQGLSVAAARLRIPSMKLSAGGPLLITHWGLSGPAILSLSAWGARLLHATGYACSLQVNWGAWDTSEQVGEWLYGLFQEHPKRQVSNVPTDRFPARLWKYFCERAGIPEPATAGGLQAGMFRKLQDLLLRDAYEVRGKSTFKEEFVTAGGVKLKEVDFRTFESRLQSGLFLIGEVLDIDALTGGFNFQAAWTAADVAAAEMARQKGAELS